MEKFAYDKASDVDISSMLLLHQNQFCKESFNTETNWYFCIIYSEDWLTMISDDRLFSNKNYVLSSSDPVFVSAINELLLLYIFAFLSLIPRVLTDCRIRDS